MQHDLHPILKKFITDSLDPGRHKKALHAAKSIVREHIRNTFAGALKKLPEFNSTSTAKPMFRTQGSMMHGTLNMPARPPVQRLDIDDGCYVATDYFEQAANPSTSSHGFFLAMDTTLSNLCQRMGWKLEQKPTCCRLIISQDAHIDVPLYATPENVIPLLEAKAANMSISFSDAMFAMDTPSWAMLDKEQVLLAMRDGGWKPSDPGQVTKWVKQCQTKYGDQFTRVVRLLKAWRDYIWESGGPSSICLMAAVDNCWPENADQNRDDITLLEVVRRLESAFKNVINNPANPGEDLTEKLDEQARRNIIHELGFLYAKLYAALSAQTADESNEKLIDIFGSRFPNSPEIIRTAVKTMLQGAAPSVVSAAPKVANNFSA